MPYINLYLIVPTIGEAGNYNVKESSLQCSVLSLKSLYPGPFRFTLMRTFWIYSKIEAGNKLNFKCNSEN